MSNVLNRALSMDLSAFSGMSLLTIKKWLVQLPSLGCRENSRCQILILSTALCILVLLASASEMSAQEAHAGEDTIVLGMSTALTGPTSILGLNMRAGVLAAIDEANRAGGINGREIRLVSLDDGYEPSRTAPNMRRLVHEEQVSAIIGNVGTPTAVAAIPIANTSKTPFVGAFTGAGVLRKTPPDRYVINYRASYAQETMAMVDALIIHGGLKPSEIAFFTQRDAYGDAGFSGGISALKHHGLKDENAVIHSRYERNTLAVENGLADIIMSNPQPKAVIMVGAYAPCAAFILLAKQSGLKAIFLNVSFVGAEPLAEHLGEHGDGVIVTQVVPHFDADLPIVDEYRKAIQSWNSWTVPTFGSLEGYIAARMLCKALWAIEGAITKEAIVNALEGLGEFDMGLGESLRLGPDEHQACHRVWPSVLDGGKAVPLEWKQLTARFGGKWHE
jgi:ABC-type branched-subunit amino acid transport system substrate-binding protein